MKNIGIGETCTENWNEMTPIDKGAFCQKCVKQVIDFTGRTASEIRSELHRNLGNSLCARITQKQEQQLNEDFEMWKSSTRTHLQRASFIAIVVVFGLGIISCNSQTGQEKIIEFQKKAVEIMAPMDVQVTHPDTLILEEKAQLEQIEIVEYNDIICAYPDFEMVDPYEYIKVERDVHILGGMRSSIHYAEYLEQVVPVERITEEYDEQGRLLPVEFAVKAYPNPTNSFSTISFDVPENVEAQISLLTMNGQIVHSYGLMTYKRGNHELPVDLQNAEPGMYFLVINSEKFSKTLRITRY